MNPAISQRDILLDVAKFLDKGEIEKCHKVCRFWYRLLLLPLYVDNPADPIRRAFQTIEIILDEKVVGDEGMIILMEAAFGLKPRTIIFDPQAPDDTTILRTSSQVVKDELIGAKTFDLKIRLGSKYGDYSPIFHRHFQEETMIIRKIKFCFLNITRTNGPYYSRFKCSSFVEKIEYDEEDPFMKHCYAVWERRSDNRSIRLGTSI